MGISQPSFTAVIHPHQLRMREVCASNRRFCTCKTEQPVERGAVALFPRDVDRFNSRYSTNVMNLLSSVVFPEPRKPVRMVTYGKTDSARNTTSQERQAHRAGLGPD